MDFQDFIDHCIDCHGHSVARDALQEAELLTYLAESVVAYVELVANVHAKLDMAREYTLRNNETVRLNYDKASAIQIIIDALELGQKAAAYVERHAAETLKAGSKV